MKSYCRVVNPICGNVHIARKGEIGEVLDRSKAIGSNKFARKLLFSDGQIGWFSESELEHVSG